jgi:hypothetical protein
VSDSVDDGVVFVCQARHCLALICSVLHGIALHCNGFACFEFLGRGFRMALAGLRLREWMERHRIPYGSVLFIDCF